MMTSA